MPDEIIPLYGEPDETYDEKNMINKLGLNPDLKISDWYFHYTNCLWAVQESKSEYHFSMGVKQLRSTISQLKQKGRKVDLAIIVMERFGLEKRLYDVDHDRDNILMLKSGRDFKIEGVTVHLFLKRQIREIRARRRL